MIKATNLDTDQIGFEWLGYDDIKEKTYYKYFLNLSLTGMAEQGFRNIDFTQVVNIS